MNDDAIAVFARQATALLDRRRTVRGIGLASLAAATGPADALAKKDKNKRKRRKRRKDKKGNDAPPPTCAEQCPEEFVACFERAADSTLCADTLFSDCTPCDSDQDCVGSDLPFCVKVDGITDRATEEPIPLFCSPPGACAKVIVRED